MEFASRHSLWAPSLRVSPTLSSFPDFGTMPVVLIAVGIFRNELTPSLLDFEMPVMLSTAVSSKYSHPYPDCPLDAPSVSTATDQIVMGFCKAFGGGACMIDTILSHQVIWMPWKGPRVDPVVFFNLIMRDVPSLMLPLHFTTWYLTTKYYLCWQFRGYTRWVLSPAGNPYGFRPDPTRFCSMPSLDNLQNQLNCREANQILTLLAFTWYQLFAFDMIRPNMEVSTISTKSKLLGRCIEGTKGFRTSRQFPDPKNFWWGEKKNRPDGRTNQPAPGTAFTARHPLGGDGRAIRVDLAADRPKIAPSFPCPQLLLIRAYLQHPRRSFGAKFDEACQKFDDTKIGYLRLVKSAKSLEGTGHFQERNYTAKIGFGCWEGLLRHIHHFSNLKMMVDARNLTVDFGGCKYALFTRPARNAMLAPESS
ncbi:hypothetical protein B0H11DRAFT_1917469 [Mycena galericulata]|nr:hypothetical protein B0H11DRAFT_1917469 [Mycena galericulata]